MSNQMVGSRNVYDYLTQYNSNNYNGSASIDAIVVHHWGVKGQEFYNVIAALSGTREASAHYVLQDGLVACIIAPGLRAWHCAYNSYQRVMPGISDVNSHTIGIECRPECTDGDVETLCQLIADLWIDYGVMPVYGHQDFMATQCPGRYEGRLGEIETRAKAIYDGIMQGTIDEEDDDMTEERVQELIASAHKKYDSVDELPFGKETVQKLLDRGLLVGEGEGKLGMTYDMLRMVVMLDRAKAFDQTA